MSFSAIAIWVFHDLKNLYLCIYIFDQNTLVRNTAVFSFFIIGQLTSLWFFLGCFAVLMNRGYSLISTVCLRFDTI